MDGILNICKPTGMSSFKCLSIVKRRLWEQMPVDTRPKFKNWKVGHLGTLDPNACGVLILVCGKATKSACKRVYDTKVYQSTFQFGIETDTLDPEGAVVATSDIVPTRVQIEKALGEMVGDIEIEVPKFSAVHINGSRAYDLVRKGIDFVAPKRVVNIKRFEILDDVKQAGPSPRWRFEVECQAGTYIRSLAKLLAMKLGTLAIAATITRTWVGDFKIEDAKSPDDVKLSDLTQPTVAC
ncbi:MAG: tRNA pseudouridine(55) synthase TruB [Christensenellaceae bacterium]|jgi:tRNA pseudouridine55 synthase|nr:tRNA pseudouridine(55) synthase TruB [Christensenellaceae bacterium]